MTDRELIDLVERTPPEELPGEVIALLRQRLTASQEVRDALLQHLQLEEYLAAGVGGVQVSLDALIRPRRGWARWLAPLKWGALLVVALAAAALLAWLLRPQPQVAHGNRPGGEQAPPADDGAGALPVGPAVAPPPEDPGGGNAAPSAEQSVDDALQPWGHLLADAEAPPFGEVCFDDFPADQQGADPEELRRWLAPVDPPELRLNARPGAAPLVDGLVRLRAPWPADVALRFAVHQLQDFRIHVLDADGRGITLRHLRDSWAACRCRRGGESPAPELLALVAADNDRYRRCGRGTLELRHHAGSLVLTRGDVRLLTAPLADPPAEVCFEGRAAWRGLTMLRSGPPPAVAAPRPLVLRSTRPARMAWKKQIPRGAELRSLPGGALQLASQRTAAPAAAAVLLHEPGLYEVLLEVEDATPGSGVFLGDAHGRPTHRVGFFRNTQGGVLVLGYAGTTDQRDTATWNLASQHVPLAGGRQWLRLVLGMGTFKCWVSGDGRHWGRLPLPPPRNVPRGFTSLGLYCLAGDAARAVTLRRFEVRELRALASLAPLEVLEQAAPLDHLPDLATWLSAVAEGQPAGIDPGAWRRACAIRALAAAPSVALGHALLEALLEEALRMPLPADQRLQVLRDAALWADTWEAAAAKRFAAYYEQVGEQLIAEGHAQPYSAVAAELIGAPIWSDALPQVMPEPLVEFEVLSGIGRNDWPAVLALSRRIAYWNRPADLRPASRPPGREGAQRLADFGVDRAAREAPRLARARGFELASARRHPLVRQISKEGYNILAELEAALAGGAYDDACQIISTADPHGALGLLSDSHDARLMVSLPGAVALAMRDHAGLRAAMQENFGDLGELRVQRALKAGDDDAVRAATVQFVGTPAAASAHQWLADRALAVGDFLRAAGHYETAWRAAPAERKPRIAAGLRLAAAMLGRDAGAPPAEPLRFGGQTIAPQEFEAMVAQLRGRHRVALGRSSRAAAPAAPPPARYEVRPLATFSGTPGRDAASAPQQFDWAGRQLSATAAADVVYVTDGCSLTAYRPDGGVKWNVAAGAAMLHQWSHVASRLALAGERVFWRRFTEKHPHLVCLSAADGKPLWTTLADPQLGGVHVASDPLLLQEQLYALGWSQHHDRTLQLQLLTLDAGSGELLAKVELLRVRDHWSGRPPTRLTAVGNRLVAAVAGCVMCCDSLGQLHWVRRQPWLDRQTLAPPSDVDFTPPLVDGRRVYVTQPAAACVECLDLDTGRRLWQRVMPRVERLLGVRDGLLLAADDAGLWALDTESGRPRWRRPLPERLEAHLLGDEGPLLLARYMPAAGRQWPTLEWIDPRTGALAGCWPLRSLAGKPPLLGPMARVGDELWVLAGENPRENKRSVLKLARVAGEPYAPTEAPGLQSWCAVEPHLGGEAASALPGWTLVACASEQGAGLQAEAAGQSDVLVTAARLGSPARLLRRVQEPAGARLILQVGAPPGGAWELEVRAGAQPLLTQTVAAGSWLAREIDLSGLPPGTWLSVLHRATGNEASRAFWKKLEVMTAQKDKSP